MCTLRRAVLPACVLIATLCGAAGILVLTSAGGAAERSVTVAGVPLIEVRPATGTVTGGVVVVHGFAGSARLMRGFADSLAGHGYAVVLPDLSGHGANLTRLSMQDGQLDRDVGVAVDHLAATFGLGPGRIALIGHSMGAAAVTRYGAAHPGIAATVAISLGDATTLPPAPDRPRNLLLMAGALEFPGFRDAATEGLHRAYPEAAVGTTVGDPGAGTARRAATIEWTEHITVLYAVRTHTEALRWIDAAMGRESAVTAPQPARRLAGAGLLLAAFVAGFVPLSAWLLPAAGGRPRQPEPRTAPGWPAAAGVAAGCLLAVVAAWALPTARMPLAVGGYAAGFLAVVGVVLLAGWWLTGRRRPATPMTGWAAVSVALALTAYAAAAIAVPMHAGFTHAVPVGHRWWLLAVLTASAAVLLLAAELAGGRRLWFTAAALAATTVALLLAVVVGTAPGFLMLVLPLVGGLFAWHVMWSAVLARLAAPAWLAALVGAVVVAWPIAAAPPLT